MAFPTLTGTGERRTWIIPGGLVFRRYDRAENSFLDFARLIATAYKQAAAVSNYPRAYAREMAYSKYIK